MEVDVLVHMAAVRYRKVPDIYLRASDPHADPDPAFLINTDSDPHQGDVNLRPVGYRPSRHQF